MEEISRQEFHRAIDKQSEYLEKIMEKGFTGLSDRMDIANGRTSKLEDRQARTERDVAILLDRASQAEQAAGNASKVAGNSKWWGTAAAGVIIAAFEVIKAYFGGGTP